MVSAAAISGYLNSVLPHINITAESAGGGAENIRRVHDGQVEMGFVFISDAHQGFYGMGVYDDEYNNIRSMGNLINTYIHLNALAGSGIRTVEDLRGRRVAVGAPGTGSALTSETLFRHLGLWDHFSPVYISAVDALNALRDGHIDACLNTPGIPWGIFLDLINTHNVVFIDVVDIAEQAGFFDAFPFYSKGIIPAGTYSGFNEDVRVITLPGTWIVNKDVPEDLVYEITKTAFEGVETLQITMSALADMADRDFILSSVYIPIHPGALRYFTEIGQTIPEPRR
jgi:TRAP transporter TAXI family solute receptor